ncbi:MAG: hypothetical protein ABL996_05545 [Micropepsaceae bacterium]
MVRAARRPKEAVAFRANARHVRVTAWIAGPGAMVFLAYSAVTTSTIGWVAGIAASALWALIAVHSIIASLDRRVLLSIGPEGLMYRYFSTKTITWSEIVAVACYRHVIATVHVSSLDTVCFSVANLDNFPRGPLRSVSRYLQRVSGRPRITIQPWFTDATSEQIVDAIRAHWRGNVDVLVLGASASNRRPR